MPWPQSTLFSMNGMSFRCLLFRRLAASARVYDLLALSCRFKADAAKAGTAVRKTVEVFARIEMSAQQIPQIIGVIDQIAFQASLRVRDACARHLFSFNGAAHGVSAKLGLQFAQLLLQCVAGLCKILEELAPICSRNQSNNVNRSSCAWQAWTFIP